MGKDWKYIAYLSAAVLVYMAFKLLSPRDFDWTITFHREDKNPFGAYALSSVIRDLFPGQAIYQNSYTLYESLDSIRNPVNFLSISQSFSPGKEDTEALLANIERGGTAFISAQHFGGNFADTLSLYTSDYFFETLDKVFDRNDSSLLRFTNPGIQSGGYHFPRKNIHNYFQEFDSTGTVVSANDLDLPVTIKITRGKGALFLNSTPLAFTNVYLLDRKNSEFAELSLSHLPIRETYWSEYYHLGRLEARTPLRFILTNEPLRWAYFIAIGGLFLFIFFEAKRRQKIIPISKPYSNTSLEFVRTIGNLYYQSNDHKNIAEKRIQFFLEFIRSAHGINAHHVQDDTIHSLARKTGNSEEEVRRLFETFQQIHQKTQITPEELKDLTKKIDSFKHYVIPRGSF